MHGGHGFVEVGVIGWVSMAGCGLVGEHVWACMGGCYRVGMDG